MAVKGGGGAGAGGFDVRGGSGWRDIHAGGTFRPSESSRFGGPSAKERTRLSLENTLGQLLDDPATHAVLAKYFPADFDIQQVSMVSNWRLEQIAGLAPDLLTPEIMQSIARDLELLEA